MKKLFGRLITSFVLLISPVAVSAQCYQNGVPCGQTQQSTAGTAAPANGTSIQGSDGTNSQTILTDTAGRTITSIYSLPALPTGTNTIGSIANTAFGSTQSGTWNIGLNAGTNAIGSITNSTFGSTQSGTWTVGLSAGSNAIGTVGVTALPALPAGSNTIGTVNLGTVPTLTSLIQGAVTTAAPSYTNGTNNTLSLTPSGALRIDGSAVTQPVSGTVAATQSGAWSISLGTGSNAIGTVGVTALPALPAGSNAIGTVGVTALPALPAGSNAIGSVTVTSLPALPTGSNTIGTVTANLGTLNGAATDTSVQAGTTAVNNMSTQLHNDLVAATPAGTNTIGNILRTVAYSESTTALGISGVVTGTARNAGTLGVATPYNYFTCFAYSDKAGTLLLQGSNNNTTYFPISTVAVAATTPTTTYTRIFTQYFQCKYTNGTTAQTTFFLNSGFGE